MLAHVRFCHDSVVFRVFDLTQGAEQCVASDTCKYLGSASNEMLTAVRFRTCFGVFRSKMVSFGSLVSRAGMIHYRLWVADRIASYYLLTADMWAFSYPTRPARTKGEPCKNPANIRWAVINSGGGKSNFVWNTAFLN